MSIGIIAAQNSSIAFGDLINASYDFITRQIVENPGFNIPFGVSFGDNGTKMYVTETVGDNVLQYDLPTPYDITVSPFSGLFHFIKPFASNATGVRFNPAGTRMYIIGIVSDSIHEYILDSPWDVSSAGASNNGDPVFSLLVSPPESSPYGLYMHPNGINFWICGSTGKIYSYTMTAPFDLSTASQDVGIEKDVSAQDIRPRSIHVSPDGQILHMLGEENDKVFQYDLTTPLDITTATIRTGIVDLHDPETGEFFPVGMDFSEDGSKMIIVGSNTDKVHQYSMPPQSRFPSEIADLILDLDSSNSGTIINPVGPVSQWDDGSGAGNNAIQVIGSRQPVSGVDMINENNAISWGAGQQVLEVAANPTLNNFWATGGTAMFVSQSIDLGTNNSGRFLNKQDAWAIRKDGTVGTESILFSNTFTIQTGSFKTPAGSFPFGPVLITMTYDASNINNLPVIRINSVDQLITVTKSPIGINAPSTSPLAIGNRISTANNSIEGEFGQIFLYDRILTAIEITKLEIFLSDKWKLGLSFPNLFSADFSQHFS